MIQPTRNSPGCKQTKDAHSMAGGAFVPADR
jgi:hypothetical protein